MIVFNGKDKYDNTSCEEYSIHFNEAIETIITLKTDKNKLKFMVSTLGSCSQKLWKHWDNEIIIISPEYWNTDAG